MRECKRKKALTSNVGSLFRRACGEVGRQQHSNTVRSCVIWMTAEDVDIRRPIAGTPHSLRRELPDALSKLVCHRSFRFFHSNHVHGAFLRYKLQPHLLL